MSAAVPGAAYCLVKSCPIGAQSYVQLLNSSVEIDCRRPSTLVILPHFRQISTVEPVAVIEELRSILTDEATLLDAATQSVWRLEIDPLTVLRTLSKLGFRATQFDVNSVDGVHTWTLTCFDEVACDKADQDGLESEIALKSGGEKRKLVSPPHADRKNSVRQLVNDFKGVDGDSRVPDKATVEREDEAGTHRIRPLHREEDSPFDGDVRSVCDVGPSGARARRFANRAPCGELFPESENHDGSVDENELPDCVVPSNKNHLLRTGQSSTILADFLTNAIIPQETLAAYSSLRKTVASGNIAPCCCSDVSGRCKSTATVAGRSYCHYAVDKAFRDLVKCEGFQTLKLCRILLNSAYVATELCCISIPSGSCNLERADRFVPIPSEHLLDIQRVLAEYWNAFVGSSTVALSTDFRNEMAPICTNVKIAVGKVITDTRSRVAANVRDRMRTKRSVHDGGSLDGINDENSEHVAHNTAASKRQRRDAVPSREEEEKQPECCVVPSNQKYILPAEPSAFRLTDFLKPSVIPPATLAAYSATPGALQARRAICCCTKRETGGECKSSATVAGRRYCHFAVDKLFRTILEHRHGFNTSKFVRMLVNSTYTANELCCISPKLNPISRTQSTILDDTGRLVVMPRAHLADIQYVSAEYWNALVRNSAEPLTDKFFHDRAPTFNKVRYHVRKLITDIRSKYVQFVRRASAAQQEKPSNDSSSKKAGSSKNLADTLTSNDDESLSVGETPAEELNSHENPIVVAASERRRLSGYDMLLADDASDADALGKQQQEQLKKRTGKTETMGTADSSANPVPAPVKTSALTKTARAASYKEEEVSDDDDIESDDDIDVYEDESHRRKQSKAAATTAKAATGGRQQPLSRDLINRYLVSEAGPKQKGLYDFLSNPEEVVPDKTLRKYRPTPTQQGKGQTKRILCVCEKKLCQSRATVAGRRYCHYAMDRLFQSLIKAESPFKTTLLCRKLLNMVFTPNEICYMSVGKVPGFVEIPSMHLADVQHVLVEYWNCYVENGVTPKNPMTDKFFRQQAPTMLNVKSSISKLITDWRSKVRAFVRLEESTTTDESGNSNSTDKDDDDEEDALV